MRSVFGVSRLGTGVGSVVALLGVLVLGAVPATAGIGGGAVPTMPATATIGDLIQTASIIVVNQSTTPNDTETLQLTSLVFTPSCKTGSGFCISPNFDPGVFKVVSATGNNGLNPCANIPFAVGAPSGPAGEVTLTPTQTVFLGPATGPVVARSCVVNLVLRAFQMPSNPTTPGTGQTTPLARAEMVGTVPPILTGTATGSAAITLSKGTPGVATTSNPNSSTVVPGTSVTDSVTVTKAPGAAVPTGSVRFILCQPGVSTPSGCPGGSGDTIGADIPLTATGTGGTATSQATGNTTAIGQYCWRALYLGDANYNATDHTDGVAECFTTVKQPPTLATLSSTTAGNVTPGSSVTDTVTVSGGPGQPTPTGTVTWFLCQPNEVTAGQGCVAGGTQVSVKALNPFGVKMSDATTNTLAVGQYCWRVEYSGNAFYLPATHTNAASECFTTTKNPSTPTTTSTPTGGNVVPGTQVSDTATITGVAGLPTPTGTVAFFLCDPTTVTNNGGDCSLNGTQIGIGTLNGSGVATSGLSSSSATLAIGKYCWRAVYGGDSVYFGSTHPGNVASECFTTVKVNPTVATLSSTTASTVVPGTSVTDTVTVSGGPGQPTPTGTVTWFLCQPNEVTAGQGCVAGGTQIGVKALNPFGVKISDATTNTLAIGKYCWRVAYAGDSVYNPGAHTDASSECFTVVDANILITPGTATNAVGTNHVLTITVNAFGGTIDAGPHTATASIVSGPGSFVGPNTCTYTGGGATASCTVTITSAATGTTVVQATSGIPVNGAAITRTTAVNAGPGGSGNASKTWADANIQITPATATNATGTNHVLTITVNAVGVGAIIDAGPHTATASIVSGPGSFVGPNTCTYTGGAATATCTVTITSATTGTTVVQATSDIPVSGQTITRTTAVNPGPGGSGNASKTWVNANIQITPATATNPTGTNHVLTITINALNGTVDAGPHTATASIVSGPGSFVGSPSCTYTGGAATATCTVTITSATTGTTVVSATSDIPVSGQTITRTTNTAVNTAAGGSGNASKTWVNANIQITPATATNPTGTNHVLTITVNAVGGTVDAGPHTATASIVSGPGSFVGSPTCTYTGGAATATCTVTITSTSTGTTVVSATSGIPVNGQTITRTTGTQVNTDAGGSGNASKTWVNANIQITPATATNPTGTNHVLTITVNAVGGTIDAGPHTATAAIVSGPGSFVGSPSCTYTGGAATATCTVTITSTSTGTTVVSATSDIPVNGQTITRTTETQVNTDAGGSGNASKTWVNANIQITPATATNPTGTNHVLTITVNAVGGTVDAGPHTATASIVSGPGSFVGSPSCTYTGGAATASCTVTITSLVVGTTVVSATSAIPVNGQTITRTTGTQVNTDAGGSDNASKTWQKRDAQVTTLSNPTGGPQNAGVSVTDTATVTGPAGQPTPQGTVTFFLCPPDVVASNGGTCSAGGTKIGTTKTLSASGVATSDATTPASVTTAAGKYCWRAEYSGSSLYNPSSHTDDSAECFFVVPACVLGYPFTATEVNTAQPPLTTPQATRVKQAFNENEVLRRFQPGIVAAGGTVEIFYNDEHTLSLGVNKVTVTGTTAANCSLAVVPEASSCTFTAPSTCECLFDTTAFGVPNPNPPVVECQGTGTGNNFYQICRGTDLDVGASAVSGDFSGTDPANRPLYPALYITDLTINGSDACTKAWWLAGGPNGPPGGHPGKFCGDWQGGGLPILPHDVFGTWKSMSRTFNTTTGVTTITVGPDSNIPPGKNAGVPNNWVIGAAGQVLVFSPPADTPDSQNGFADLTNQGFGAEIRWNVDDLRVCQPADTSGCNGMAGTASSNPNDPRVSDLPGHVFRIYFMVHDGDQHQSGGDVGHDCATVFAP